MSNEKDFNVYSFNKGDKLNHCLIEASAGTGKTYNIERLFLRLLFCGNEGRPIPIESILVVTFTKLAAAELKNRIRSLLRNALEDESIDGVNLSERFTCRDYNESMKNLSRAAVNFQNAEIMTIHSMASAALNEHPVETGWTSGAVVSNDKQAAADIVLDYLRRLKLEDNEYAVSYLAFYRHFLSESKNGLSVPASKIVSYYDMIRRSSNFEILPTEEEARNAAKQLAEIVYSYESSSLDEAKAVRTLLQSDVDTQKFKDELCQAAFKKTGDSKNKRIDNSIDLFDYINNNRGMQHISWALLEEVVNRRGCLANNSFVENIVRKGSSVPKLTYQAEIDALTVLIESKKISGKDASMLLFYEIIKELDERYSKQCEKSGIYNYDDLLFTMKDAVSNSSSFKGAMSKKYKAVLIDEFQDTDQTQWGIFKELFLDSEHSLICVGDPKQAIYSFRGADLPTYFEARESIQASGSLKNLSVNYRSSSSMISAFNEIFSPLFNEGTFVNKLEYLPVRPPQEENAESVKLDGKLMPPAAFVKGKSGKKDVFTPFTADEINNLLSSNACFGDGRKVRASDIAVLCRYNSKARQIAGELHNRGINSIVSTSESVGKSKEAQDLLTLLTAIERYDSPGDLRHALMSQFFGLKSQTIQSIDGELFTTVSDYLRSKRNLIEDGHFFLAINSLLNDKPENLGIRESYYTRMLKKEGGLRSVTNTKHIIELLNKSTSARSVSSLREEMIKLINAETEEDDEKEIRLEREEDAVNVLTLHKSKGLEFPIVFIVFGSSSIRQGMLSSYHDDEKNLKVFGMDEEIKKEEHGALMEEEKRLIYVAVTRASSRVYIPVYSSGGTVFPMKEFSNILASNSDIQTFCAKSPELFEYIDPDVVQSRGDILEEEYLLEIENEKLEINLERKAQERMKVSSFSSIAVSHSAGYRHDYDESIPLFYTTQFDDSFINEFTLKPGKETGSMLHKLFEELDFSRYKDIKRFEDFKAGYEISEYTQSFIRFIYPDDKEKQALAAEAIVRILYKSLFTQMQIGSEMFRLIDIDKKAHELQFLFPCSKSEFSFLDNERFSVEDGMLTGYIDFCFRYKGKYYILDWKSNYLGDKTSDYSKENIELAMKEHNYSLQYYIYLAALYKQLSQTEPGFNYKEHFGGAIYLFIRAVSNTEQGQYGVFYDLPSEQEIKGFINNFQEKI